MSTPGKHPEHYVVFHFSSLNSSGNVSSYFYFDKCRVAFKKKLQEQMMIFLQHTKTEFLEEAVLLGMEDLPWAPSHIPGYMVRLIWKPKSTNLSKKHTVQF